MNEINIAKTIIDARKKKGISRKELARKLGYTISTISHWENGIRKPTSIDFVKMIYLLEINIRNKKH